MINQNYNIQHAVILKAIKNTSRFGTKRCFHPTPIGNLFVLAGVTPTELCRKRATLCVARHAMDPKHFLHYRLLFTPTTQQRELKSRHPFVPAALKLLKDLNKFKSNNNTTAIVNKVQHHCIYLGRT